MADTHVTLLGYDITIWGVGVAIIAAILPQAINLYVERNKSRRERKYVEVQLIFLLDKFASGCEGVAWDSGFPPGFPENGEGEEQQKSPVLGLANVKGELKFLKAKRLHQLQSIDIRQLQIEKELRETDWEFDLPDMSTYFRLRRRRYAELGLFTAELTRKICRELKIDQDVWNGKETPESSCLRSLKKLNRGRADTTIRRNYNWAKSIMRRQEIADKADSTNSANDE